MSLSASTRPARCASIRPACESLEGRRLLAVAGDPDPSFDGDGVAAVLFPSPPAAPELGIRDTAVQQDGKVVAVGVMLQQNVAINVVVVRLNADGGLDPTFGTGGRSFLPTGGARRRQ